MAPYVQGQMKNNQPTNHRDFPLEFSYIDVNPSKESSNISYPADTSNRSESYYHIPGNRRSENTHQVPSHLPRNKESFTLLNESVFLDEPEGLSTHLPTERKKGSLNSLLIHPQQRKKKKRVSDMERKEKLTDLFTSSSVLTFEKDQDNDDFLKLCLPCLTELTEEIALKELKKVREECYSYEKYQMTLPKKDQKEFHERSPLSRSKEAEKEEIERLKKEIIESTYQLNELEKDIDNYRQNESTSISSIINLEKEIIELEKQFYDKKAVIENDQNSFQLEELKEKVTKNLNYYFRSQLERKLLQEEMLPPYYNDYPYFLSSPLSILSLSSTSLISLTFKELLPQEFLLKGLPFNLSPYFDNILLQNLNKEEKEQIKNSEAIKKKREKQQKKNEEKKKNENLSETISSFVNAFLPQQPSSPSTPGRTANTGKESANPLSALLTRFSTNSPTASSNSLLLASSNSKESLHNSNPSLTRSTSVGSTNEEVGENAASALLSSFTSSSSWQSHCDYAIINGRRLSLTTIPAIQLNWGEINLCYVHLTTYLVAYRNLLELSDQEQRKIIFYSSSTYFPKFQKQLLSYLSSEERFFLEENSHKVIESPIDEIIAKEMELKIVPLYDRATFCLTYSRFPRQSIATNHDNAFMEKDEITEYLHLEGGIQQSSSASASSSNTNRNEEVDHILLHYYRTVFTLIVAIVFTKLQLYEPLLSWEVHQKKTDQKKTEKKENEANGQPMTVCSVFTWLFPSRRLLILAIKILLNLSLGFEVFPLSSYDYSSPQIQQFQPETMRELLFDLTSDSPVSEDEFHQLVHAVVQESIRNLKRNNSEKRREREFSDEKDYEMTNESRKEIVKAVTEVDNAGETVEQKPLLKDSLNSLFMEGVQLFSFLVNIS
jgi:hypothetical protein